MTWNNQHWGTQGSKDPNTLAKGNFPAELTDLPCHCHVVLYNIKSTLIRNMLLKV